MLEKIALPKTVDTKIKTTEIDRLARGILKAFRAKISDVRHTTEEEIAEPSASATITEIADLDDTTSEKNVEARTDEEVEPSASAILAKIAEIEADMKPEEETKTQKPKKIEPSVSTVLAEIAEEIAESSVSATMTEIADTNNTTAEKTDRGNYESIATYNYFENWDDLEIEGNAELKETIRQNILAAEKRHARAYERAAADLGISVEDFKTILQAKVEEMVGQSDFFRATHFNVFERILNVDGRWKSQFETHTSQGTLNPEYRARAENAMFGFLDDLEKDKEHRPIYGYFSDETHGAINGVGKIPPPTNVNWYGAINFKIKKSNALKKATITFHDSLGPQNHWPPTPAIKPHFTSLDIESYYFDYKKLVDPEGKNLVRSSVWAYDYTEAQFHNQLTMEDIESIHISVNNSLTPEQIQEIRRIFNEYKKQHPESKIELIEF